MTRALKRLLDIGVHDKLHADDVDRLRLVNTFAYIALIPYIYYLGFGIYLDNKITIQIATIMFLGVIVALISNSVHKYSLAKVILFIFNSLGVFVTHQIFNINNSFFVFFFPIIFCFTFLFKLPEERKSFFISAFATAFIIVSSVALPKHLIFEIAYSKEVVDLSSDVHFIVAILLTSLILLVTFRNKKKERNRLLTEKQIAIEATNKLKDAQGKLVQSEKMASLGMLVAGINHEINNPLNYIFGGVEILKREMKSPCYEESRSTLGTIEQGVVKLRDLLKSLNDFNEYSTNDAAPCDIHSILDNCVNLVSHQFKYDIHFKKNYWHASFVVKGNSSHLHQVFINALTNACQAIEEDGIVTIQTQIEGNQVIISIEDNGVGIPEHIKDHVFDHFFTTKEPGQGTGLGLSIAYDIIEKHRGSINIQSREGKGTKVFIALPLATSFKYSSVKE